MVNKLMPRSAKIFLLLYLLILALFLMDQPLGGDGYYYWDWSHHLALSYYDGPPLIAYAIKLVTSLFGHHVYSLRLLSLICAATTAMVIFRLGKQLFDARAGQMAMMIWLLTASVVNNYFIHVTYDVLLILFWALTFYAFVQLVTLQYRRYYYYCAVFAGLLLLAKYTGILLLVTLLLLTLFEKRYRFVWRSVHSYLSIVLVLILFSPVIIWNWHHGWASFHFQLSHGLATYHLARWKHIVDYFYYSLLGGNVTFVALLYLFAVYFREIASHYKYRLLVVPTLVVWIFFFIAGFFSITLPWWQTPYLFTAAILLGPFCCRLMTAGWLRLLFILVLALPTVVGVVLLRIEPLGAFAVVPESFPIPFIYIAPTIAQNLLSQVPLSFYRDKPLLCDTYGLCSYLANFIPGKRYEVFGLTPDAHQYYYWWQQKRAAIVSNRALYFTASEATRLVAPLKNCELVSHLQQKQQIKGERYYTWQLFVYACELVKQVDHRQFR